MKAIERLFSCASAHSIDLKQMAGESVNLYGAGAPRRRQLMRRLAGLQGEENREVRETIENRERLSESVKGKQSRVARPRMYSHAELGQALSGLTGGPYHAAMFSFGLDEGSFDDIYRELRAAMADMDRKEKWPIDAPMSGRRKAHYGDELCEVVLLADWCKPFFIRAPGLYAIYLGVTEETWSGALMRPYLGTLSHYERWLARARKFVDNRIYEEIHAVIDSRAA